MGQLILEFPLPNATLEDERVIISLGNGVSMSSGIPSWVKEIKQTKLQVILEIEGDPPHAYTSKSSI